MPEEIAPILHDLPEAVSRGVVSFVDSARKAFGSDLRSAVLYGSAAEGRLRPTSDVNLLLVVTAFDPEKASALRGPFSAASAAIRLTAMVLLESEVQPSIESFAQKFSDILRRRRVLWGPDPFAGATIARSAVVVRLKQVLLNLALRLRSAYLEQGSTPERLSALIAESSGPIRTCAATLLELEGQPPAPPREALRNFVSGLGDSGWNEVLDRMSETRERQLLSPDQADSTVLRLIELAGLLRARAETLS